MKKLAISIASIVVALSALNLQAATHTVDQSLETEINTWDKKKAKGRTV